LTKQEILDDLNEILANWKALTKALLHDDLEELRDELRRDLNLFPEVYTCPTH
jgi:hypothetical protein